MTIRVPDFDFTYEEDEGETPATGLTRLGQKYPDLTFTLTGESGPGGGWPTASAEGPDEAILAFLRNWESDPSLVIDNVTSEQFGTSRVIVSKEYGGKAAHPVEFL